MRRRERGKSRIAFEISLWCKGHDGLDGTGATYLAWKIAYIMYEAHSCCNSEPLSPLNHPPLQLESASLIQLCCIKGILKPLPYLILSKSSAFISHALMSHKLYLWLYTRRNLRIQQQHRLDNTTALHRLDPSIHPSSPRADLPPIPQPSHQSINQSSLLLLNRTFSAVPWISALVSHLAWPGLASPILCCPTGLIVSTSFDGMSWNVPSRLPHHHSFPQSHLHPSSRHVASHRLPCAAFTPPHRPCLQQWISTVGRSVMPASLPSFLRSGWRELEDGRTAPHRTRPRPRNDFSPLQLRFSGERHDSTRLERRGQASTFRPDTGRGKQDSLTGRKQASRRKPRYDTTQQERGKHALTNKRE